MSVNVKAEAGEKIDEMRRLAAVAVVKLRCDEVVCWMSGYEGISTVVEDELRNSGDASKVLQPSDEKEREREKKRRPEAGIGAGAWAGKLELDGGGKQRGNKACKCASQGIPSIADLLAFPPLSEPVFRVALRLRHAPTQTGANTQCALVTRCRRIDIGCMLPTLACFWLCPESLMHPTDTQAKAKEQSKGPEGTQRGRMSTIEYCILPVALEQQ
ncbi:uncharacterized protein BDZ83DRAFT_647477 [Colletotrichum acutatum]|uniref:Uncharacterized protein n=1 Tax=Glomerella acutata TaxID=27357 RepID=A0AAD8XM76_GLOAC|nr:uncharacterized protein BDZ83DRAFT_647477 [Colletotrichum acutatum]KAK1729921.1 hypothetical protein BDZ83DRAFT_647477 [Colletotrichum acutatum]